MPPPLPRRPARAPTGPGRRTSGLRHAIRPARLSHGPMPSWPRPLDHVAEGWWRLPPRLRTVAILVLVGIVGWGIVARTSASPYGASVQVVVAVASGTAGEPIRAALASRPGALVPDGALDVVPAGRLARDVGPGEVLTRRHVAQDLADLLDPDEVALALPDELPALPPRARLEVLATRFDGVGDSLGHARLLTVEDGWVWVAMPRAMAAQVAAASTSGRVTLAVAPP